MQLAELLGSTPNFTYDNVIQEEGYSVDICYSTCLQRLVYTTCNCFDIRQVYAYSESGVLCGSLRNESLTFFNEDLSHDCIYETHTGYDDDGSGSGSEDFNNDQTSSHLAENFLNCLLPYNQSMHNLLDDIKCLHDVKKTFDLNKASLCDCKPPCKETTYELITGQSIWPAEGSQTFEAQHKINSEEDVKLYKYFLSKGYEEDALKIINYLADYDAGRDVMGNFARLTVYASSPAVMQVQQIPAYTLITLISDIGMKITMR